MHIRVTTTSQVTEQYYVPSRFPPASPLQENLPLGPNLWQPDRFAFLRMSYERNHTVYGLLTLLLALGITS